MTRFYFCRSELFRLSLFEVFVEDLSKLINTANAASVKKLGVIREDKLEDRSQTKTMRDKFISDLKVSIPKIIDLTFILRQVLSSKNQKGMQVKKPTKP